MKRKEDLISSGDFVFVNVMVPVWKMLMVAQTSLLRYVNAENRSLSSLQCEGWALKKASRFTLLWTSAFPTQFTSSMLLVSRGATRLLTLALMLSVKIMAAAMASASDVTPMIIIFPVAKMFADAWGTFDRITSRSGYLCVGEDVCELAGGGKGVGGEGMTVNSPGSCTRSWDISLRLP